jgi:hypothetical protein
MSTFQDLHTMITTEAQRLGLDPALALSLAQQESGFNPEAHSPTGVVGLYQVTNKTGAAYGQTPETRTDPQVSARAGLGYLKDLLLKADGNVETALTRYNGGSDPRFAQHVLRYLPTHQFGQALYGDRSGPTSPGDRLGEALYGPLTPAAPGDRLGEALYGAVPPRAAATTA